MNGECKFTLLFIIKSISYVLNLNHQKLEVYQVARKFVFECYKLTKKFPSSEQYAITIQIRKAALSTHLNIAEGASRRSIAERKRYFEIARSSVVEIDAALDIAFDLNYFSIDDSKEPGITLLSCFKLLSKLIDSIT